MSGDHLVQLLALFGSLGLVSVGLTGRRLSWCRSLQLAAIWAGIFAIVTLFLAIVTGE